METPQLYDENWGIDPEHYSRIEAERITREFATKSTRRIDVGKEPIEDSPLFGGERQGGLFND